MSQTGDKAVTWKQFIAAITIVLTITASVATGAWQLHCAAPHAGALSEREFDAVMRELSRELQNIHKTLERIEDRLDASASK